MEGKLRMGVIGIGMAWQRLHWPALQKLSDKYEVVAVCNKTISKAIEFADSIGLPRENVYDDYVKLLQRDDLDVVDILVPISENYEMAEAVIESGKRLIAEKPFASTPEDAEVLIQLKNKEHVQVMVAENFRYDEGASIIKEALVNGSLGKVTHFIFNSASNFEKGMTEDTYGAKEWRQHPDFKGGSFLDGGIHDIAMMRHLFGDIDSVYATGHESNRDYCPYNVINTVIKFKNGISGQYCYYTENEELNTPPVGLRIYGTNGELYYESKDKGVIKIFYTDGHTEEKGFEPNNGYYHEFLNFYDAIKQGKDSYSTPEKEYGDIQAVFNIMQSVETDTVVKGQSIWVKTSPMKVMV